MILIRRNAKFIFVFIIICLILSFPHKKTKKIEKIENNITNQKIEEKTDDFSFMNFKKIKYLKSKTKLKINNVVEYNNLDKEEILNIRKMHMKSSIFYYDGYKPKKEIFGKIESGKPWFGLTFNNCQTAVVGEKNIIKGASEESRIINNPDLLLNVIPYSFNISKNEIRSKFGLCSNSKYWGIPSELIYDPELNELKAKIKIPHPLPWSFSVVGVNARDLGFNYVFAKTAKNIEFLGKKPMNSHLLKINDFYSLGTSCGLEGGCNNMSRSNEAGYFSFIINELPANIVFKLWNRKPNDLDIVPDIYYSIEFIK